MSLDWNRNGKLDTTDFLITEMLEKELEESVNKRNNMSIEGQGIKNNTIAEEGMIENATKCYTGSK